MTLGSAAVACLSLVWLSAACSPIRCPDDRIAVEQGCWCPEGTVEDGGVCHRDMVSGERDDGGGFDSTGQRGDGGGRDPRRDGSVVAPPDAAMPPSGEDAGSVRDDAGSPPPPPVGPTDDGGTTPPPVPPPGPPPPTPEPSCVERCPSRQCDGTRCLECVSDRDCQGATAHCAPDNRCVACTSNEHCGAGRECSAQRTCVTAARCPDGVINGTEQCEIGSGWYTADECLQSCTLRFWSLCGAGGACPGGQRCFRGMCAPEPCVGARGSCQYFNNLVEGFNTYCPSLRDNPVRLVAGLCVPRCGDSPCPATLTCIDSSFCAAL